MNKIKMIKVIVALVVCHFTLMTASAQTIANGSCWWDGERLYTATVDEEGNVRMDGESVDMGGSSFMLYKNEGKEGSYTLASTNSNGWIFIRGEVGWQVDHVRLEGMNFLAVRKPNGDCCYTLTLTPDNLENCVAQQEIAEQREVSWMLQNYLMSTRYLGRFSKSQLRLMRNEILARHGWTFQSKDLKDYFSKQPWYKPVADNNSIKLSIIEMTNVQLIKSEEAEEDDNRVRYENTVVAPEMVEAVEDVITVTTEEQFINALGNNRTIELGADVHLNLSRILEREEWFSGIPGRAWVTIVKRSKGNQPVVISEFTNDGQQLVLRDFCGLTIRGKQNSSIEVNPRYSFCLSFMDCLDCVVENLTIGHTEGGYCDGGVIGVEGGSRISVSNCDLYGCGTYGVVTRETREFTLNKTNIHDCTYGIMEIYGSHDVKFQHCDFFNNREYDLVTIRGCSDVEFDDCRFYGNWAEAPLFSLDDDITLKGCEIYHPNIGERDMLQVPEKDCKWGNDASFEPKPRKHPIGPDVENGKNKK